LCRSASAVFGLPSSIVTFEEGLALDDIAQAEQALEAREAGGATGSYSASASRSDEEL